MESLVTVAITGPECITNRQTNRQTDILLYIYRWETPETPKISLLENGFKQYMHVL
jgi:hypothetical protein